MKELSLLAWFNIFSGKQITSARGHNQTSLRYEIERRRLRNRIFLDFPRDLPVNLLWSLRSSHSISTGDWSPEIVKLLKRIWNCRDIVRKFRILLTVISNFHHQIFVRMEHYTAQFGNYLPTFWNNLSFKSSTLNLSCYPAEALKMGKFCSPEMSVCDCLSTLRHIRKSQVSSQHPSS